MKSYLAQVQKHMGVYSRRQSRTAFAGNYGSVLKGRSIDFDDLREYVYGDDAKEIDWKATARSRQIMVRRYTAVRKHNIMIVADNGKTMAAMAPSGENKADVAVFCAGVVAYIAQKNGDIVGLVAGNHEDNIRFPLKENSANIENFLDKYRQSISENAPLSDMNALLSYIAKTAQERLFLAIITDPSTALTINRGLVRRLRARHEQMFCFVNDAPFSGTAAAHGQVRDIEQNMRLPRFVRHDRKFGDSELAYREARRNYLHHVLRHYGAVSCFVDGIDSAVPSIMRMLEEKRHARS